jgi:hypothetical protein
MRLARTLGSTVLALAVALTLLAAPAHAVPTSSISFTASPTAKIGQYNLLTVSITSSDGVTQPEGGVIFRNQAGEIIGSAATGRGNSVANAVATLPWWPTQQTSYVFTAQYNVAPGIDVRPSDVPRNTRDDDCHGLSINPAGICGLHRKWMGTWSLSPDCGRRCDL